MRRTAMVVAALSCLAVPRAWGADASAFELRLVIEDPDSAAGPYDLLAAPDLEAEPEPLAVSRRVMVSGETLACVGLVDDQGFLAVTLMFDETGRAGLEAATGANVGRRMALVLEGRIVSAPMIMSPLTGPEVRIASPPDGSASDLVAKILTAMPGVAACEPPPEPPAESEDSPVEDPA